MVKIRLHCESLQLKEIADLNEKVKPLEFENREKSSELSDFFERLELVEQIIAEREEAVIAAAKAEYNSCSQRDEKEKEN